MRVRALAAAVALTAALAGLTPALPRLTPTAAAAGPLPVTVELTAVGPAAVTPDSELTVTGRLVNTSTSVITDVHLQLRLRSERLTSRADVQSWSEDAGTTRVGTALPVAATINGLAPGTSTPFTLRIPADQLGLPRAASGFGPRGLAVAVADGSGTTVGLKRTTFVWFPGRQFTPTSVSMIVPITNSPARENVSAVTSDAVAAMSPTGRLSRLLAAASDADIAYAVDPSVLETARLAAAGTGLQNADGSAVTGSGTSTSTASPSTTSPSTTSTPSASGAPAGPGPGPTGRTSAKPGVAEGEGFLAHVRDAVTNRTVYQLPYADPDITALARRGAGDAAGRADDLGEAATKQALGRDLDDTLSWPGDGQADTATLAMVADSGHDQVVLSSDAVPTVEDLGHTVTGRTTLPVADDSVDGLLYDPDLSEQFGRTGVGTGVDGTQQLISELAAVTLERPSDRRHLLLAAPRGWDPQPGAVNAAVTALRSVPWVTVEGVDDLAATDPPEEERAALENPATAVSAELSPAYLGRVLGLDRKVAHLTPAFSGAGTAGAAYAARLRTRASSMLSLAWRGDAAQDTALGSLQTEVLGIDKGVVIARSSTVNLLASEAEVPVIVDNTLSYPLDVVVSLRPRSGQVAVRNSVRVTLPAGANRQRVLVPVQAVASGNVELEATVRTVSGELVGSGTVLDVRVRRGWEARGLGGAAAVLLLLLALGLIRGARSGRPNIPAEAVPDVDDLATERARRAQVYPDVDTQQIPRVEDGGPRVPSRDGQ